MKRRLLIMCLSIVSLVFAGTWVGCRLDQGASPTAPEAVALQEDGTLPEDAGLSAKTASTAGQIRTGLKIATHLRAAATADGCENNPGPFITLSGEIRLGGLNGRLIFRNNEKGTHTRTEDVTVDVVVLNEGEVIQFAKQPPQGGVGGNPYIWIQFYDGAWQPLSGATLLGRCVQGLSATSLDFGLSSRADVRVTTGDCDNSGGQFVTLSGELRLGGINAKLIFTNNAKGTHERDETVEVGLVILDEGEAIRFAKQPPQGGVGGNPHIYFQFTDASGNALSNEFYLGRCVQLGR